MPLTPRQLVWRAGRKPARLTRGGAPAPIPSSVLAAALQGPSCPPRAAVEVTRRGDRLSPGCRRDGGREKRPLPVCCHGRKVSFRVSDPAPA